MARLAMYASALGSTASGLAAQLSATGRVDTLAGRVTTELGAPVAAASVIVTRGNDFAVFRTVTDAEGVFRIVISDGSGDYLVYVAATGRVSFRQRLQLSGVNSSFSRVDVVLKVASQALKAVRVEAERPVPSRFPDPGTAVGGSETIPDELVGLLPPAFAGNLASMAATLPGMLPTENGFSVLGLPSDLNQTTLNGLSTPLGSVPRDAPVRKRIAVTAYDPARGGFGGALTSVELQPGSVYSELGGHLTVDAPSLQFGDAASRALGQSASGLSASVGGSGPMTFSDRYFYSFGAEVNHRAAPIASLASANAASLNAFGLSAGSVNGALETLRNKRFPIADDGGPRVRNSDQLRLLSRFDWSPIDVRTFRPPRTQVALIVAGDWTRTEPYLTSPGSEALHGASHVTAVGQIQGIVSTFIGDAVLSESRLGVSVSQVDVRPHQTPPEISVRMNSVLDDGTSAIGTALFGGGSAQSSRRLITLEGQSEAQYYPVRAIAHRLKLTTGIRLDSYRDQQANQSNGTFSFNSLDALAANTPASFTQLLNPVVRSGSAWNTFLSAGDLWRASPSLQLQYGLRAESGGFLVPLADNRAAAELIGASTTATPSTIGISPRLGFTWTIAGGGNNGAMGFSRMGKLNAGPTGYVKGGIGEFRSLYSPYLLSPATAYTGLPDAQRSLSCVGPATPVPDWGAYAAGMSVRPRTCAGSAQSAGFTDTTASVFAVDSRFQPARSWRANLQYGGRWNWIAFTVEGVYSINLDLPSQLDANLVRSPAFTLADEGRPVFVPQKYIDAGTGVVSPVAARTNAAFGSVVQQRSDASGVSRQLIVTLAPDPFRVTNWYASLSYALSDSRVRNRNYDATTFGSPFEFIWARSPLDVRHQVLLRGGVGAGPATFTLFARLQSGVPFTPLVGSDVNGDGRLNDRAFVFAPNSASATAMDLTKLMGSSAAARKCLANQLGEPAKENSCDGPWSAVVNAQLTLTGGHFGIPRRVQTVALSMVNVLGGVDQLLHGADNLHGWGTRPTPDPVLYYVRGFDAGRRAFTYDVNPRFASTSTATTTSRAPFGVTLEVSIDLGRNVFEQQVERSLRAGRKGYPGPRLTIDELKRRYAINIPDPYTQILRDPDALFLVSTQITRIQDFQVQWAARRDSILTELATYLAALPDVYDVRDAMARQEQLIGTGWEEARISVQATLPTVLSEAQLRALTGDAAGLLKAKPGQRPSGRTLRS